ncbi:IS66 family insertion sequence element accessory protein TnpB [Bradyrhizobium tunisiense]|uniref:IS66 family insertion sequence element accessory protein TnpB n=1 Tax=Bradyrhizobium tunisiense TaxID=3278709 RepID=UPI0035DCC0A4
MVSSKYGVLCKTTNVRIEGPLITDEERVVWCGPAAPRVSLANRHSTRLKVLVHDGIGVWLTARRLNQGRFTWTSDGAPSVGATLAQFDALALGLPWQRMGEAGVMTTL